ncbi:Putative bZIP transcription factor superfamily protein [Zea mays]|uniref:Putative bZIP transcription factor superfamily protein n=1 Tax=Zea mays TaxID=4577 RepID=A0A1D6G6D6_MAIZE|nr:Putative bZIP transcription factor superfamily protein [Zea mays]
MASAQAPSSAAAPSRKDHLEAGKKRLEQFRKKKAAKKATAASAEQAKAPAPDVVENPPPIVNAGSLGDGLVSDVDPNQASTSSVPLSVYENGPASASRGAEFMSNGHQQDAVSDGGRKFYGNLSFSDLVNGHHENWRGDGARKKDEHSPYKDVESKSKLSAFGNGSSLNLPSTENMPSWGRNSLSSQVHDTEQSSSYSSSTLFGKSKNAYAQDYSTNSDIFGRLRATSEDSSKVEQSMYASTRDYGNAFNSSMIAGTVDHDTNVGITRTSADSTPVNSERQDPFLSSGYPTTYTRSRPSFLDMIGVQRAPLTTEASYREPAKANQLSSYSNYQSSFLQQSNQQSTGSNAADIPFASESQEYSHEKGSYGSSTPPDFLLPKEERSKHHGNQTFQNFTTHGKDDDFAALEQLLWFVCQLIEDLTKEKFSLQQSLQKSQELAETLATDNSALTDKFNQQAHVISQLTSDMERLQEEIQAQLLALESIRTEYANAQLECSAADERAKVLAAEVILLEDKGLRLRSSELKLEKEVEGLHSEISSYRRKVSSLEKERQHLQSTVKALQEEKKLLRNIPVNEKATTTVEKPWVDKRDASTATEDLDIGENSSSETLTSTVDTLEDAGISVLRSNIMSDFSSLEEVSSSIPDDQLRMIDNINSLMSELVVEREALLRALRIESSNCSKLKELNKDLTQKLEIQTQRLELLTSQRMANENALAKPIDTRSINDATMYADEGDEVVERVLGWIMKLFPGGPKRRTSKLL